MLQENIVSIIRDAKNALDPRGGLKAVYFVGCGGSWAASHTAFDFVSHENTSMLVVCARLRHVAGTQWGNKKYMNMKHLEAVLEDASIAG